MASVSDALSDESWLALRGVSVVVVSGRWNGAQSVSRASSWARQKDDVDIIDDALALVARCASLVAPLR
jgi:hypothetical protein